MRPVSHVHHTAFPASPKRGTQASRLSAAPVIRYGFTLTNHNETLVGAAPVIRHGLGGTNHNETLVSAAPVIR